MDPLSSAQKGADHAEHPLSTPIASARALASKLSQLRPGGVAGSPQEDGTLSPLSLSDDEMGSVQRLAPDPDSPTSRLLEQAARRQQQAAESKKGTPEKFSFAKDIARNPQLAKAARAELLGAAPQREVAGPLQHLQHGAEIDRQTAVIDQLDRDAKQESSINQEMAGVMLGRLQSAKTASERVLGVVQAFAGAETAYARSMEVAAKLSLVGEGDGLSLRAAMEGVSDLPMIMGAAHGQLASKLAELVKVLHSVLSDLRAACEEIVHGAGRAKRSVDSSRKALKVALAVHMEACRAFDVAAAEQQRHSGGSNGGAGRLRGVEQDPWLTEGRLVEQQTALQRAQQSERQYLSKAFQRVGDLERRRGAALKQVFSGMVSLYSGALIPVQGECGALESLLREVDPEADLKPFWQAAASAGATGDALSERQAETLEQIARELMASPHILKQGGMERWEQVGGRWVPSHFVLTQAGFLHYYDLPSKTGPAGGGKQPCNGRTWGGPLTQPITDTVNLSRCAFEQGEAPMFRIIEAPPTSALSLFSGKGRARTLKASTIEDCMDWAIAIRDAIAACSGR